jgi:hypothetical protein
MSGPATMAPGGKCRGRFGRVISLAATLITEFEPVSRCWPWNDKFLAGVAPSCWQRVRFLWVDSTRPSRVAGYLLLRTGWPRAGPQRPGLSRHLGADRLRPGRHRPPGCGRYQWPPCTTSSNGRRLGRSIGRSGRSAGDAEVDQPGPEPVIGRDLQGPGAAVRSAEHFGGGPGDRDAGGRSGPAGGWPPEASRS